MKMLQIIGRIQDGSERPRPKVIFDIGEVVRVIDGPFANFQGVVDEVFRKKAVYVSWYRFWA